MPTRPSPPFRTSVPSVPAAVLRSSPNPPTAFSFPNLRALCVSVTKSFFFRLPTTDYQLPLSPFFPLHSVHSLATPLFPLDTKNLGGYAHPRREGIRPYLITIKIDTQTVSKLRRQLKYYFNCRHADILQWHSHSWLCPSQMPSTGKSACATTLPATRRSPLPSKLSARPCDTRPPQSPISCGILMASSPVAPSRPMAGLHIFPGKALL